MGRVFWVKDWRIEVSCRLEPYAMLEPLTHDEDMLHRFFYAIGTHGDGGGRRGLLIVAWPLFLWIYNNG